MNKDLQVTELDVDQIKNNLIEYFKRSDSPFKDWDFAGSGLNTLIEILAYNTHYNAVLAHTAVNEGYLDSARIRGNVVSRAKLLGYIPRSAAAARAAVNISFNAAESPADSVFTIQPYMKFVAELDGIEYLFSTTQYASAPLVNGQFSFENVELIQGDIKTLEYQVNTRDTRQKFVINDKKIDLSTLQVRVWDNASSDSFRIFRKFETFENVTSTSSVYFLYENAEGFYEISFGDGVIGRKLDNLNIVEIEFISTDGPLANKATGFVYADDIPTNFVSGISLLETTSPAAGGAERETIESIRFNAPLTFVSQNRAVTTDDYRSLIRSQFQEFDDVSVWGGDENTLPEFGKVFVSVKPKDSDFITPQQKTQLLEFLRAKKIVTILPEILDANYISLFFDIFFKYDSRRVLGSPNALVSRVYDILDEYENEYLSNFDRVFRYSQLLTMIDQSGSEIINSFARVYMMKSHDISTQLNSQKQITFAAPLALNPRTNSYIWSSPFTSSFGPNTVLTDRPADENNVRTIHYSRSTSATGLIIDNVPIGNLNIETGEIAFNGFVVSQPFTIQIYTTPRSFDLVAAKNTVFKIDNGLTTITPEKDIVLAAGSSGASRFRGVSR